MDLKFQKKLKGVELKMTTKHRYQLFGYETKNGEISVNSAEATEVKNIFSEYLQGSSYKKISDKLTEKKIDYLPQKYDWNKNRVKRILENTNYIGNENYPQIIAEKTYFGVQNLIASKSQNNRETPKEMLILRGKIKCENCGKIFKRNRTHHADYWRCECKNSIEHGILIEKISELIVKIQAEESLLLKAEKEDNSAENLYIKELFKTELSAENFDENKLKSLIFSHALAEYKSCDGGEKELAEKKIKAVLQDQNLTSAKILTEISEQIFIDKNLQLKAKLNTGKII